MASALKRGRSAPARPARPEAQPAPPGTAAERTAQVLSILAAALAAAWVFRGALAYGFSQDDWFGVARAAGLSPRLTQPWRYLSAQAAYDLLLPRLGALGIGWHLLPLAVHAAVSGTLVWLFARRWSLPAAFVGACFFACHPASFDALYWFSAHSDVLATAFALAAFMAAMARGRARWWAVPLWAAALLEKESVLLMPLVLLAAGRARGRSTMGPKDPVWLALTGMALLYALYFVTAVYPARFSTTAADATLYPGASAYGIDPARLFPALLTYAGWAAGTWAPTLRGFSDALDPGVFAWGGGLLVLVAVGWFVPALRKRDWHLGPVAAICLLAPMLPLTQHVYHYYAYAALAGVAATITVLFDALLHRWPVSAARAGAAVAAALLVWNGAVLVAKIESMPFVLPELRAESIVDRARIAAAAIAGVRAAQLPPHSHLVMWSPQSQAIAQARGDDPQVESYFESNVRTALIDGLALRVGVQQLDSVRFARAFEPSAASEPWAVYRPDGSLRVLTAAQLAGVLAQAPGPPPASR